MNRVKLFAALLLALTLAMPVAHATGAPAPISAAKPAAIASASASDVVKKFYEELTDTMKKGDQLGFSGRYKKLDPVVKTAFNLPLMTRFAVGLMWDKASPAEQQQLVDAFSAFSVANYASRFQRFSGEQFDVIGETPIEGGVIVETKLKPKDVDAIALNYLMRKDENGAYRIVDVYLDGAISELATRRAEFSAIVNRDGIPALVNSLDEKSKQMGPS